MATAGRILIIPRGEYDADTEYTMLDLVCYEGRGWICKQTCTGVDPVEGDYWSCMFDVSEEIEAITSKLGETDISGIGDGTVTGGLSSVNESLGKRNLQTYTAVAQIDKTYTIANFEYKNMPQNAVLSLLFDNTSRETAYANNLIPISASGELEVCNIGNGRGHIKFHVAGSTSTGTIYYAFVTFASLSSNSDIQWNSYVLNSDLESYTQSTTVNNIEVVSSLPSDAADHTDTLYIITE